MFIKTRNGSVTASGIVLATLIGGGASAAISINPGTTYPTGAGPSGVAMADFNGDGAPDIATTADGPDRVVILINDGAGGYALGAAAILPNSSSPQDVISADLDGDGDMDLAVALRDPAGAVQILLNNGTGGFVSGQSIAVGDRPRGLDAADHDGDGDIDLAVANRDGDTAHVITNNGGASFSASQLAGFSEPRATAFGDFDGDGDLDLAVTSHDDRTVRLFTNNGGTFSVGQTLSVGGVVRPDGVDSADLNGDGLDDLAVAISDQNLAISQAAVFLSTGVGFSPLVGYDTLGLEASQLVAVDLDCDGLVDLAVVNQSSNNVATLTNQGGGTYGPAQLHAAGTRPGDVSAADVDGDGDLDLAVENRDSNNVSVFVNDSCAPAASSDLNGDSIVNADDLFILLGNWGPCPGCAGDLNADDVIDANDLFILLGDWS